MRLPLSFFFVLLALLPTLAAAEAPTAPPTTQLAIDRVELMPNRPTPFALKDFKAVARGYDKLVFDFNAKGEHLPLIWWDDTKINMPMRTFGMPSYVGKNQPHAGEDHEAITTIGAVLGATTAGIDKSAGEHNWVEMCQAYFNTKTGQNVVLNNIATETGKTYWYETFPQILFNSLVDRYPATPNAERIMRTAADRWHDAYIALSKQPGGLNFDHTAFNLVTMQPVDNGKWHEPDGAAGIAWIQYSAYQKFGDKKYLEAAEALTSYLEGRTSSPLYEIDMPFGAYVAARLNAENDKNHDVGRLLNWCFNPSETRSGWGVIVGNWGGYEVSGLAGSVSDGGGYGFVMNTFAMGGALVPIARYDDRYARAIGKWMLNAMNAVRICYPDELPRELQSCPDFKSEPANVIPYEGIRKTRNGKTPYASGDPLVAGWGKTDLGLYGGGFVGMFAGIIAPSDDPMIPQLNLLATDFFHDRAYPSYLYYNPYDEPRTITLNAGEKPIDIYDSVQNDFVLRGASANAKLTILPDSAAVAVVVPANATLTYDGRRTIANGVVIDYDNGRVARPAPAAPPVREDSSQSVTADRGTMTVDGNPLDWSRLKSQPISLDTGGRGKMECDLRYAWDDDFLYILVQQTKPAARVHEAENLAALSAAVWDFDGIWLHLDMGNGRLPSIGDLILSLAFSSTAAQDLYHAPAVGGSTTARIQVATSGSAEKSDRVIEGRIAWAGLLDHTFNNRKELTDRFGPIRPGLRFGCEPSMLEYNHTGQSFIGGAQYRKPTGFDANSRDIVLENSGTSR